ncbi:MAG: hypothetical protein IIA06_07840 [Proteobacteria bacterium]|nr:hypothetical protein [Pseudomonadota bacterium]MCH8977480.1 hypothetical protein [Pseudomonadota bacterium]
MLVAAYQQVRRKKGNILKHIHVKVFLLILGTLLSGCSTLVDKENNYPKYTLERGPKCYECENYPTDVNLRFDEIELIQALQLLAGFSCNDIKTNYSSKDLINPNYTEVPWDTVVRELCGSHGLHCWTENETLFVSTVSKESDRK